MKKNLALRADIFCLSHNTAPLHGAKALTLSVKMNKFLENMVYVSRLVSSPL